MRAFLRSLPTGVRQLLKFGTVGVMNTAIDWSLAFFLTYYTSFPRIVGAGIVGLFGLPMRPEVVAVWVTKIVSSGTATINSFIWNRRWTFRIRGKEARARQFAKFVTVNIIGMVLNSTLTTLFVRPFLPEPPRIAFMLAQAGATALVFFWNFFANKYWTFRTPTKVQLPNDLQDAHTLNSELKTVSPEEAKR